MKAIGAALILIGCGGVGFSVVRGYRYQVQAFSQLIQVLEYMRCELQFKMTPLPELCCTGAKVCPGCISSVLQQLNLELEAQIIPDAGTCMYAAVEKFPMIPEKVRKCLLQLGDSLGRFDLQGQLQGLDSVKKLSEYELELLRQNQDVRLRNYQTLGFCAGAVLVILFL